MESPVCTPIGSIFSIEQMMMALSARSRTTSISYSFQPSSDSSINTSVVGEASSPPVTILINSSRLYAIPPPVPPMVKLGRMIEGSPVRSSTSNASSSECAMPDRADSRPILVIASRNLIRSSALSMASASAPIISTPYFASVPSLNNAKATFSAVCPPMVGNTASGHSFSMILATISGVIGSTYVASAISGSVIIVAGLELTRMMR